MNKAQKTIAAKINRDNVIKQIDDHVKGSKFDSYTVRIDEEATKGEITMISLDSGLYVSVHDQADKDWFFPTTGKPQ